MTGARGLLALLALCASGAHATTIGPDAFGHTATDAIPYAFVDVSGSGTRVLGNTDDGAVTVDLGFPFDFYGVTYTTAGISSNGVVTFGHASAEYGNVDLTTSSPSYDGPTIAVLWDDWVVGSTPSGVWVATLGVAGSREFVVQWNLARGYGGSSDGVTFQAILSEADDSIVLQYQDVVPGSFRDNGASATVGIRDAGGHLNGRNLQWSFRAAVIENGQAIFWSPSCGNGTVEPHEGCDDGNLTNGDGCEATCTPTGCGDGSITGVEECDDGNIDRGDCCSPGCELDPVDEPCTEDGNLCTLDRCDGAGTCLHPATPSGDPCPDTDGNVCTTNPQCDGGGNCVQSSAASGVACPPDADLCTHDVCDGAGACSHPGLPQPVCRAPTESGKGRVILRSDRVTWRWTKGAATTPDALGNPQFHTDYAFCVYDASGAPQPLISAEAPRGGNCVDRNGCWVKFGGAARVDYVDPTGLPDGLTTIHMISGVPGKASVLVKGKLSSPSFFLAPPLVPPVVVQVHNGNGECWGATYSTPLKNDTLQFKAKPD